jgi:Raf kinase inhibitor-like YbhB/YbcL family protein
MPQMWVSHSHMRISHWLYAGALLLVLVACSPAPIVAESSSQLPATEQAPIATTTIPATLAPSETPMPFVLTSPGIEPGGVIPRDFACTGDNTSPQLDWNEPPSGTQSFALIFNDPDASSKGFVHWIVYNIPADARSIPADIPAGPVIQDTAVHGSNGWGRTDYGGPCPPEGSTHNYVFTLFALDVLLDFKPGAVKADLEEAMHDHVLATATLTASFSR